MNICLIGNGLTSLSLAKNLINKKIKVFLYYKNTKKLKYKTRTIGISKSNYDFFNKEIINFKKSMIWKINQISIYIEKYKDEKILNFQKFDQDLFCMIKNDKIYDLLESDLKKNKFFKKILIKNKNFYKKILKNNKYDLIINCESNNKIYRNYFYSKISKNYNSYAHTAIIKHKKINNTKAIQIFTKLGPIAFLPISETETSIVYSIYNDKKILGKDEFIKLILHYNKNYKINNFSEIEKFKLEFSVPRNYYYKNSMAFGDLLHKNHPLVGQGFNMTLRDIKILSNIIQDRIDLGLPIDSSVYFDFEKKSKHLNFLFSSSIDLIHEFFRFCFNLFRLRFSLLYFLRCYGFTPIQAQHYIFGDIGLSVFNPFAMLLPYFIAL